MSFSDGVRKRIEAMKPRIEAIRISLYSSDIKELQQSLGTPEKGLDNLTKLYLNASVQINKHNIFTN